VGYVDFQRDHRYYFWFAGFFASAAVLIEKKARRAGKTKLISIYLFLLNILSDVIFRIGTVCVAACAG
jgi:hypothetical protein